MFTALKKIKKPNNAKPDDLETQVAQAIFKLEVDAKEVPVKSDLQAVHFVAAKEVRINKQKKAILIFVPPRQMSIWQRLHTRIVRELEKKFSGRHVLIIGQRKALKKPTNPKVKRPRARTLQAVQENLLEDVCYPVDIVGKRTRYRVDGTKFMKVYLDPKEQNAFEHKTHTFSVVYKMLTGIRARYTFDPTM